MSFNVGDKVRLITCRHRIYRRNCGQVTEITGTYWGRDHISYYLKGFREPLPANVLVAENEPFPNNCFAPRVGDYVQISGDFYDGYSRYNGESGKVTHINNFFNCCTISIDESHRWFQYFSAPVEVSINNVELIACLYCPNPCHKIKHMELYATEKR